jgi:antitoxin component of MazEF toxin-antitoxin module
MLTSIINIGNSKGVRIPKPLLTESGLKEKVELKAKKGEIRIIAVPIKSKPQSVMVLLSEKALGADWNRPEEDKAWASLQ